MTGRNEETMKKSIYFSILLLVLVAAVSSRGMAAQNESVLVGRVSLVEGEVLRYVPEERDWVALVEDAPFGLDDAVYAGESAKAEFIIPNRTRVRIGEFTQIQSLQIRGDLTEMDVASGMARFYNNSESGVVRVTTPFGYVVSEGGSSFDIYVGDQSVEVIAVEGVVDFVDQKGSARYEVTAGMSSLISDGTRVSSGDGGVDSAWHAWNEERDRIWSRRVQVKGESARYLPDGLYDDSYVLDEYGRWERVPYEGAHYTLWRPSRVAADWEPYSVGRWSVYHGDNAWMPYEPFGYITHHYGSWVYLGTPAAWYWAPPVRYFAPRPVLNIGFSWYPGRVFWIHSGSYVGWFPLAPYEPYYAHRYWGPRTTIVRDVRLINVGISRFRYVDRSVIINQSHFYRVNNYRDVRMRRLHRDTIIRSYRPAPVLSDRVIRDYRGTRERYNFRNVDVRRTPHDVVLDRVRHNRQIVSRRTDVRAANVQRDLRRIRERTPERDVRIDRPRVSGRMVQREDMRRPRNEVRFDQRDIVRQQRQLDQLQQRQERAREWRQRRMEATPRPEIDRTERRAVRPQDRRDQRPRAVEQQRVPRRDTQEQQQRIQRQREQQQQQQRIQRQREQRQDQQRIQRQREQQQQQQRIQRQREQQQRLQRQRQDQQRIQRQQMDQRSRQQIQRQERQRPQQRTGRTADGEDGFPRFGR
jgi:hypothetical protein